MKKFAFFANLIMAVGLLCSCSGPGEKAAEQTMLYGAMAILSVLLLIGCFILVRKRELLLPGLFASIAVVNSGYFLLAVSNTLQQALWANRIAYLGSVFLPMLMLLIMLRICKLKMPKWLGFSLWALAGVVFFIAASPGWLPIYYKEVELVIHDGVASLEKVYGPLHILYLFYLLGYFSAMIGMMILAGRRKLLESKAHAAILAVAVFANIGVWLLEQLVEVEFEMLSVSYIISELFLLGLYLLLQENERRLQAALASAAPKPMQIEAEKRAHFEEGIAALTKTERAIFELYVQGKNTLFVLDALSIKENTLKYHNRNIYAKLGVSSRKELLELYKQLKSLWEAEGRAEN